MNLQCVGFCGREVYAIVSGASLCEMCMEVWAALPPELNRGPVFIALLGRFNHPEEGKPYDVICGGPALNKAIAQALREWADDLEAGYKT